MEKELRWLSVTDDLKDVKGKSVYSEKNLYMGKIVRDSDTRWILDGGGGIRKMGSSHYYIKD